MDPETDLFVQAFWVKCSEVIRPELDRAAAALAGAGRRVGVSSQEYEASEAATDGLMPSLTLSVDGPRGPSLEFAGDVVRQTIVVSGTRADGVKGSQEAFELAQIDAPRVKALVAGWI